MNISNKKVSIVIYAFNGKKYIRQAIDSCLNQTYANVEIIIIDDASDDKTPQILKEYKDNPRITVIRNLKVSCLGASLNTGFAKATGDYFTWIKDVDFLQPNAIEEMLRFLSNSSKVDFVYADYYKQSVETNQKKFYQLPDKLEFVRLNTLGPCFLYSSKIKDEVGKYNAHYEMVADYDYWIRVSKTFAMVHYPQALCESMDIPYYGRRIDRIHAQTFKRLIRYRNYSSAFFGLEPAVPDFHKRIKRHTNNPFERQMLYFEFFWKLFRISPGTWLLFEGLFLYVPLKKFLMPVFIFLNKVRLQIITAVSFLKIVRLQQKNKTDHTSRRVLCLIPQLVVGGSEKVVGDIVNGLKEKGYTFYLLGARKENNAWAKEFAQMFSGVLLLPADFIDITINNHKVYYKVLAKMVRKLGIKAILISNPRQAYDALPRLKEECPDVKVVDLIHLEKYAATADEMAWVAPYLDRRVCISRRLREVMLGQYQKLNFQNQYANRMEYIYNGNDMKQFNPDKLPKGRCKERYKIASDKKVISSVARMAWIKRPLLFVDAAKILVDKGLADSLVFVMAGDGKDTKEVKERISKLGMQDKFILTGSIPQNEVRELLADSYMFWLVSEMEGLALVAVEAMSMNVPVITTDVGAMNEAIDNGKNGFLIHPYQNVAGDVAAITEKLLKDPQLYNEIACQSRLSVLSKFSMDVMIDNYSRLFQEML